jgi:hypothetical protein
MRTFATQCDLLLTGGLPQSSQHSTSHLAHVLSTAIPPAPPSQAYDSHLDCESGGASEPWPLSGRKLVPRLVLFSRDRRRWSAADELGLHAQSSGGIGHRVEVGGHAEGRGWELVSLAAPSRWILGWMGHARVSLTYSDCSASHSDL